MDPEYVRDVCMFEDQRDENIYKAVASLKSAAHVLNRIDSDDTLIKRVDAVERALCFVLYIKPERSEAWWAELERALDELDGCLHDWWNTIIGSD